MQSPCKDCTERKVGCHSVCEKYLAYKESREEIRIKRQQYLQSHDDWWRARRTNHR